MAQSGLIVSWGATHRHNGVLVVRMASIAPPGVIKCVRLSCLWNYLIASLRYTLIMLYHRYRVEYAESHKYNEAHRDKDIPYHYRTGVPSPDTIWGAAKEIVRLKIRR